MHETFIVGWRDLASKVIQPFCKLSKRVFSSGGLTGTKYPNCLYGMVFESLQLLKSAYHNSHISAASDAKQHIRVVQSSALSLSLSAFRILKRLYKLNLSLRLSQ
jgi:hypothetical protein